MAATGNQQTAPGPRVKSYYTATINQESNYPQLNRSIDVDVAIVGGGFTGVNTALELAEKGVSVALIEANKIGWGASGRNGGQITGSLSGAEALRRQLSKRLGSQTDDYIWLLRWRGHDIIKQRVARYQIDCDLRSGHLHAAYKAAHLPELAAAYQLALQHGMADEVSLLSRHQLTDYLASDLYQGALLNRRNMHVHPLNLVLGEARAAEGLGVQLFEQSPVLDIHAGERPVVTTAAGQVTASKVLLAGNAYHRLLRPSLSGKLFPCAGGIVATEPLSDRVAAAINPQRLAVYDCRFVLDYYRFSADNRLLFGGGAHYSGRASSDIAAELRPALERTFPQLRGVRIDYAWSGLMGIVLNRIPQLGQAAANVFYAQGYSGHGIATSHIVAEIMAHALRDERREFDLFAGCRHWHIPGSERLGNLLLVLGMAYYQLLERLR